LLGVVAAGSVDWSYRRTAACSEDPAIPIP